MLVTIVGQLVKTPPPHQQKVSRHITICTCNFLGGSRLKWSYGWGIAWECIMFTKSLHFVGNRYFANCHAPWLCIHSSTPCDPCQEPVYALWSRSILVHRLLLLHKTVSSWPQIILYPLNPQLLSTGRYFQKSPDSSADFRTFPRDSYRQSPYNFANIKMNGDLVQGPLREVRLIRNSDPV